MCPESSAPRYDMDRQKAGSGGLSKQIPHHTGGLLSTMLFSPFGKGSTMTSSLQYKAGSVVISSKEGTIDLDCVKRVEQCVADTSPTSPSFSNESFGIGGYSA